ncbi:hypothetical protein PAMP_007851 [Pampus punctatissimus]
MEKRSDQLSHMELCCTTGGHRPLTLLMLNHGVCQYPPLALKGICDVTTLPAATKDKEKNRCVGSTKAAADCVCDVYRSQSCRRFTVNISFIAHTGLCIYRGAPVSLLYTFGHPQSTGGP